jgi:hydroxyacylglutathione hydrolase
MRPGRPRSGRTAADRTDRVEEVIVSAIRRAGKINDDTTLIDTDMGGSEGVTAVYLVRGVRTCLIDAGASAEAPRLVEQLRGLDAFPPDLIVLTHPHWDHTQGIPVLRQEAARLGKEIEVVACGDAVPLLADASFNDDYGDAPYASIQDVTAVEDGDAIDLGGIALRVIEVPGHCRGDIAILDENNGTIYVGDALGYKLSDTIFLPPFMPPCWDYDAFRTSVEKLRRVPYGALCLAHFGCIGASEARDILDEAVEVCDTWWRWYERHVDGEDDDLLPALRKDVNPDIPDIEPVRNSLAWLATGYRQYKATR